MQKQKKKIIKDIFDYVKNPRYSACHKQSKNLWDQLGTSTCKM